MRLDVIRVAVEPVGVVRDDHVRLAREIALPELGLRPPARFVADVGGDPKLRYYIIRLGP